jgi:hypothetical protein
MQRRATRGFAPCPPGDRLAMADPDDASPSERSDEPPGRRGAPRRPVRVRRAGMLDSLPRMLWHVLPGTDHFRHEASPACPCHPEVECSA